MNAIYKTSRILGIAFLLQFVTSFLSGTMLSPLWNVPGNIGETMTNIAARPTLFQLNILVDMLTAFGVVFLGAMLYLTLQKQNKSMALVALGIYIVEAVLLAASKLSAYSLLLISQEYAATGQPAVLQTMGNLALQSMNFVGSTLHVMSFGFGAILFYSLLYRSGVVPRPLSLWGLVTVIPVLVGMITALFGYALPFILFVPYVPFEFVIGIWILIKGVKVEADPMPSPVLAHAVHGVVIAEEK